MTDRGIMVLCAQETWTPKSGAFITDSGFLVINSGGQEDSTEKTGAGFIVAAGSCFGRGLLSGDRPHGIAQAASLWRGSRSVPSLRSAQRQ
eukprot:1749566-Pyramimonas_sp.AAC.1